ncbi:DUF1549 and DUF1553 domain-containing protein [Urbifossiella limnaea]|uniref:Bacterial Ig-like domain (Group 2) n=1 Tax=Urbifossiella limnaea TaxID=2528023 RepID=A0A517XL54_9BACT|nr:DUF1549 and DUF1553 domain-containing protein [Urbifossiella limnaea]QDU18241.1 Bacterial Ig-like domain (group 2) [Urbifossiella limnaea]
MPARALVALLLAAATAHAGPPPGAPQRLLVHPARVAFAGPREQQQLVVTGVWPDGRRYDLTRAAAFAADPKVVSVVAGVARPVADGATTIAVTAAGASAAVPVTVEKATADEPVNFTREIVPILTRANCNGGGCHGAQHGRGGFRLSLAGFDPAFDFAQIVQSNEGRRVVPHDPERSILLAKPALVMEHGGGEKLKLGGRDYARVRQWLADGAPGPAAKEATVSQLEVFPAARVLVPVEQQQLAVTAVWSDGRREDVTASAQFDHLNESVAAVTPAGLVTAKGAGETHVMVRFAGQVGVAQLTLPFATLAAYPKVPTNNFIDEKLVAKWRELGLTPSPLCSDDEFLRRLYLDAIGTLPTPDEVRAFLADADPLKRQKAIDRVLERAEFIDWWALKWGDLLRINRTALQDKGMWSFHNWVRAMMRDGTPLDVFAREIVTAEGSTFLDGPANFYQIGRTPEDWAESVAQVFLGIRVGCARCHHHPFERWGQDDYYGLAAFFARLGTKNSQEYGIFGRETVIFLRPTGESNHPRTRAVMRPTPLDADKGRSWDDPFDRRKQLAAWLTAPDNGMFSRNLVNRFWGYTMGRGLVEPLDDIRATNPASNPELLDALAADFVRAKFDMKHLLRTIFNSRAYQLDSTPTDGNRADAANVHFARYTVRRLTAEQLADAIDFATGTREKYPGLPLGTRAIQLPDSEVKSYLMDTFGRPARQVLCECERTTRPNIAQAMHLLNGDFLNKKIADKAGRVEKLMAAKTPVPKAIDELFLATWSRPPSAAERTRAEGWVAAAPTPREGLQDVLWVLVNSREFLFSR